MTKKQKREIRDFLIFLHLNLMAQEQTLNAEGYIQSFKYTQIYPQFRDIKKENKKIFGWLEEKI